MTDEANRQFAIVPLMAAHDTKLSDRAFRVLACLSAYADKNGHCYPSMAKIAKMLGVSKPAIVKQVRALEKAGYVETRADFWPSGRQRNNIYKVAYSRPLNEAMPPEIDEPEVTPGVTPEVIPPVTPEVTPITDQVTDHGKSPPLGS